jgi:hypothetical protein
MSSSHWTSKDEDDDPHPNDEPPSVIQNVDQRRSLSFSQNSLGVPLPGVSSDIEGSSLGSSRFANASGDAYTANALNMNSVDQTLFSAAPQRPVDLLSFAQQQQQQPDLSRMLNIGPNLNTHQRTASIDHMADILSFMSFPASAFSTLTPDTANVTGPSNTAIARDGNPRSILNERYQKNYNRSFTKSDFVSIKDTSNGDHIPHFTSVFVCPESGECFMSGVVIDGELVIATKGMNWYTTKKIAEFAAAGRAEDNFCFRSAERTTNSSRFCNERPYIAHHDDISSFLEWGSSTREKVDKLKQKAAQR